MKPKFTNSIPLARASFPLLLLIVWAVLLQPRSAAQVSASTVIQRLGYPPDSRLLILHSDDLGMSHSVNRATFEALQKGWITSASIMVPCPWFSEAAEFARSHPEMDLGLHLTLTSEWYAYRWGPVGSTPGSSLMDKEGYFPHNEKLLAAQFRPEDVSREIRAQIDKARASGVEVTHLDSHMGSLFQKPELFHVYQQVAHDYRLPYLAAAAGSPRDRRGDVPAVDALVLSKDLQMRPGHLRRKWLQAYEKMLAPLKPGVYQLILHLGYDDPELEAITYGHSPWGATWRQADLDLVRNPEFQRFLRDQKFIVITWKDLARAMSDSPSQSGR